MSKIFLTGSTGFIGSHLMPKLIEKGYDVITDMRYFDEKYICIIHLAAKTHIQNIFDPQLIESNIILSDKVFRRSERIIYASSCSAAHFTNPYAMSKMWSEHLGRKQGNSVGLRFHNVYGWGGTRGIVWFLLQQKDGDEIKLRGSNLVRDYIYVCDVCDYITHCMSPSYNGVLDVGTGIGTRTIDLVSLYQKVSGKKFTVTSISSGDDELYSHEPHTMISNNPVPGAISLRDGLIKTIQDTNA